MELESIPFAETKKGAVSAAGAVDDKGDCVKSVVEKVRSYCKSLTSWVNRLRPEAFAGGYNMEEVKHNTISLHERDSPANAQGQEGV